MKARDALAALAATVTLWQNMRRVVMKAGDAMKKIVRFATVDTVRAGWLIKNDGIWTLTGEGAKALKLYKDPLEFHKEKPHRYTSAGSRIIKRARLDLIPSIAEESDLEDESDKASVSPMRKRRNKHREKIDTFPHAMDAYDSRRLVAELS